MKKANTGNDENDGAKRKLGDLEDLVGDGAARGRESKEDRLKKLPVVEFGKSPQKWLEVQRERWTLAADGVQDTTATNRGSKRASLFDGNAMNWAHHIPTDAWRATWHIVSVEPVHAAKNSKHLRYGDSVIAQMDEDGDVKFDDDADALMSDGLTLSGVVVGFVGDLVKVSFEDLGERIVPRRAVQPPKE
jgi:hypothetical protein